MKSDIIDIACEIRRDDPSKKAIAVADGTTEKQEDGREREKWFWLPRALVEINGDGAVAMPEWLAIDKGLV